ncbi:hypothetical protein GQ53DRAFT_417822 [Thozetella sp. PMI_491]|nr:hypothetical protein GQ53DRAFT_417822 [Thozetella sp. PMI_491]
MFTYLMSFYQVRPVILDFISAFTRFDLSSEGHNTGFHGESSSPDAGLLNSGYRIQQCYRLRYFQQAAGVPMSWHIQQLLVYHCYEAGTGRSLWITANSDEELDERLKALVSSPNRNYSDRQSLELAISTHLAFCEWCDGKWQDFVGSIHRELDGFLNKMQTIDFGPVMPRSQTRDGENPEATEPLSQSGDQNRTGQAQDSRVLQALWNKLHGIFDKQSGQVDSFSLQNITDDTLTPVEFSDIQRLYRIKDILGQALLMVKINASVLGSLGNFYRAQDTSTPFVGSGSDFLSFAQKVSHFESSMRIYEAQLETMMARQRDGKALMDDIATFRNLQSSRFFADTSLEATRRGEILMREAGQNSKSMHIITIITLVFLPGTFVTTLMQSGVFVWDGGELQGRPWLFRLNIFLLFLAICLIMTAVTVSVWVVGLCHANAKARKRYSQSHGMHRAVASLGR